jgi:signal transduction histidine kinase
MKLIREALNNAVRHGNPRHLSVLLRFERRNLRVEIADDGCGFDASVGTRPEGTHYGILGMRERVQSLGGEFLIASAPGQGTRVQLRIPISERGLSSGPFH